MGDVRRWLYDQMGFYNVTTWFQPDLRLQRKGRTVTSRGFLAVEPESTVILPGDVLHLDFGITCMGLNTDWQKEAYVLLPGQTDAPSGLKHALANTNTLQESLMTAPAPPLAGDVYNDILADMKAEGSKPKFIPTQSAIRGTGLEPGWTAAQRGLPSRSQKSPQGLVSFYRAQLRYAGARVGKPKGLHHGRRRRLPHRRRV